MGSLARAGQAAARLCRSVGVRKEDRQGQNNAERQGRRGIFDANWGDQTILNLKQGLGASKGVSFHADSMQGMIDGDLQQLFQAYDLDGNGHVDIDEFMEAQLLLQGGDVQKPSIAVKNFLAADAGKSGFLSFEAFRTWQLKELDGMPFKFVRESIKGRTAKLRAGQSTKKIAEPEEEDEEEEYESMSGRMTGTSSLTSGVGLFMSLDPACLSAKLDARQFRLSLTTTSFDTPL